MNKRIGIYLRVSTVDQNTALQSDEVRRFLEARGWTNFTIYEDKRSGTNGNRPAFKAMMKDARERKIDVVVCWKLDRLFRSLKDLIATLQEFSDLGVDFISLKDNIDMTTSVGRLLMHMLGAFGEFEASLIRERVRAGLNAARARGKRLGRPKTIDSERIVSLRAEGLSIRQIAKTLGISKSSVQVVVTESCPENPCKPAALSA